MTGASARRRPDGATPPAVLALLATIAVGGLAPASTGAADDPAPIHLSDSALAGVTTDLDGDGAREAVALLAEGAEGGVVAVVWDLVDGRWQEVGRRVVERHVEDATDTVPVRIGRDGAGILVLADGPAERVIAVSFGEVGLGSACCLTLAELTLERGVVGLATVPSSFGTATELTAIDSDGDGVDEILASSSLPWEPEAPPAEYRLIRRDDDGSWRAHAIDLPPVAASTIVALVGDSDGVVGDDVVLAGASGATLQRLVGDGQGGLVLDVITTPSDPALAEAWFAVAADGRNILQDGEEVVLVSWPRGGEPRVAARMGGSLLWLSSIIGYGPSARLLVADVPTDDGVHPMPVRVVDLDLRPTQDLPISPSPSVTRVLELLRRGAFAFEDVGSIFPYTGPIHGGTDRDEWDIAMAGTRLTLDGQGMLREEPIGSIAGIIPLGTAGHADAWMLTTTSVGSDARGTVGIYAASGEGTPLSLVPSASVFAPDPTDELALSLDGAVELSAHDGGGRRIAARDPFVATVRAPGWRVLAAVDDALVLDEVAEDASLAFLVTPRQTSEENQDVALAVILVSPTGQLRSASWDVALLREPPALRVSAPPEVPFLATRVTVTGSTTPLAAVTVDGVRVAADEDGGFRAEVDAPIWPRDVIVTAVDPVGNETTASVEVVGVVDHRGWPWAILIGFLTVAAGGVMYLRASRLVAARAGAPRADDGQLEELDEGWSPPTSDC